MAISVSLPSSGNAIEPLAIASQISALLHPGKRNTGILICGGWGYEDLLTRTALNVLARRFSARGFAALRFDYPSNGDSLDQPDVTLDNWISAARNALQTLQSQGFGEVVIIGHGFGTIIARILAEAEPAISGMVLMAPTTPRRFLRETKHFAAMLSRGHNTGSEDDLNVAGFRFPPIVQSDLAKLKDPAVTRPIWTLTVDPALSEDAALVPINGTAELRIPYRDFDVLMTDPILQKIPVDTFERLVDLLDRRFSHDEIPSSGRSFHPALLKADGFREEAFFFGSNSLYGVLCEPAYPKSGTIVLFLNMGKNPHIGWGRATVHYARKLAAAGIASLRFDISGIGESLDDPDVTNAVLFSEEAVLDVQDACDAVTQRGFHTISLMGICSGAYLGLLTAVKDKRVERLFAINLPRFEWKHTDSAHEIMRFSNRPDDHTVKRLLKPETLRAILKGTLDPRPAVKFKAKSLLRRFFIRSAPYIHSLSPEWNIYSTSRLRMDALAARRVNVLLAYSHGDDSPREMELLFGRDGKHMPGRQNIEIHRLDGVDHNFSQAHAIEWLTAKMIAMIGTDQPVDAKSSDAVNVMAGQLMFG